MRGSFFGLIGIFMDCRVHGDGFDHFLLEACKPGRKQDALTSLSGGETVRLDLLVS
jgi:hypothetical protein